MTSIAASPDTRSQARALPPSRVIGFAVALSLATIVSCLELASGRSHPGIDLRSMGAAQPPLLYASTAQPAPFEPGTVIAAISSVGGPRFALRGDDLSEEPDSVFAGYPEFNQFMQRQQRISEIQHEPEMELQAADGRVARLRPVAHRPLSDLPFIFWLQVVCAIGSWLTGAAIFAFRPQLPAAKYSAVAGFGALTMAASAAVYSSRELALPGDLFRYLSGVNHFGALLTSSAMFAVLWHYPQPLNSARPGVPLVLAYMLAWLADFMQWLPFGNQFQEAIILAGYVASLVLAALQWRAARGDPLRRAALQWFILSWFVGSGAFLALVSVPAMAGPGQRQPAGLRLRLPAADVRWGWRWAFRVTACSTWKPGGSAR